MEANTRSISIAMATPNPEPVFVKELADKYKCSICTNLLDTPVLTECCAWTAFLQSLYRKVDHTKKGIDLPSLSSRKLQ